MQSHEEGLHIKGFLVLTWQDRASCLYCNAARLAQQRLIQQEEHVLLTKLLVREPKAAPVT